MGNASSSGPQGQHHSQQQQGQLPASPSATQQRQMLQVPLPGHGAPSSAAAAQQAAAPPQQHTQRYVGTDAANNRISVDIRSQHGDAAEWQVHVKRQDPEGSRLSRVESGLRGVSTTVQSVAGAFISVLMVAKLVEEILFVRKLRKELNSITAAIADPKPGGLEQGQSNQARASSAARPGSTMDLVSMAGLAAAGAHSSSDAADAVTWDKIAGLHEVKMLLQEVTVLPTLRPDLFTGVRQPPRGVLLFGPPGSGKTLLARAVASESRSTFIPITGSSILSMWFGQSEQNVKALFERARRCQPAVIFIDEVDSLLGRRSGSAGPGGGAGGDSLPDKRVTNEFLSFIDGIQTSGLADCRITLMAATNTPWDLDEAALSRFARRIYVPLPDKDTRAQLIKQAMCGVTCDLQDDEYSQLSERLGQYSGRDLMSVCREAAMQPVRELWGNRLLAGGQEGDKLAAQQRLLLVVAEQLRKGQPAKRIRRELEAYRKRMEKNSSTAASASGSGASTSTSLDWLNVDDIMVRAVVMAAEMRQKAAGAGGSAPVVSTAVKAAKAQKIGPSSLARRSVEGSGGSSSADASTAPSGKAAECTAVLQRQSRSEQPMDDEGATGATGNTGAPAPAAAADAAGGVGSAGPAVLGRTSVDRQANAQAVSSSTCDGEGGAPGGGAGARSGDASAVTTVAASGGSSSSSRATGRPPAPKRQPSASGKAKGKGKVGAGTEGAAGALSMQALLSLPCDQLRPVRLSDFERALSLISPSDFEGVTARFEEWNGQYGSGADRKGRDRANKAFFSMYV